MMYMLHFKVFEDADDCSCHSNCSQVLFLVLFSLYFLVGFPLFHALLLGCFCFVRSEIHNFIIGSSLNSSQID